MYRDWKNTIDTAVIKAEKRGLEKGIKEGMEEGIKEGIKEGEKQKAEEIARQMKACGLPAPTISRCTGLGLEQIDEL